jgi:hypothetical protein
VTPFARLSPAPPDAVAVEGAELLRFAAPETEANDVRIIAPVS